MKNKIYIILRQTWGDGPEIKDSRFFESEQDAIDYADKTIYPEERELSEIWLTEGDYKPTEEEIFNHFKNAGHYTIKELKGF